MSKKSDILKKSLDQTTNRRSLIARGGFAGAAAFTAAHVGRVSASVGGSAPRLLGSTQEAGGTMVYGLGFDVDDTLDPQVTNFDSTIRVTLNVCEPLLWMPNGTEFYPGLAESWDISEDGTEYTFHLKEGVTFHDGTPFNAEAVQFTFDRITALDRYTADQVAAGTPEDAVVPADTDQVITPGQSHDQIGPYDHSEIIDDYTIKMVLSEPFTPFLSGLNGYTGIVSPTAVQDMGLTEFARAPVGTGPYKFEEWIEGDHITLTRNDDYTWGSSSFANSGAPLLEKLEFRVVGDRATRTLALTTSEMNYIDDVDPLQLEDLKDNSDIEVIEQGQPGSGWVLLFNVDREGKPQMEMEVRQALAYALDKNAFNEAVFGGTNVPASSPLMKPTFAYEPKTEELFTYDTAKCEEMLDAAGWVKNGDFREKDGEQLFIYWPIQDRENDKNMATFVQGAWREVGVDVQVEAMERGAAREKRVAGDYDISFLWFSYADPDILRAMFHTSNIGGFNFSRYSNPDVDQWLTEAAQTQDLDLRKEDYSKVQMKVTEDAITIPMADSITYNAKLASLQGEILDYLASYVWWNSADFTG